jgi:hypothetical protein
MLRHCIPSLILHPTLRYSHHVIYIKYIIKYIKRFMGSVTLNLISIGVFLVTASVLLGPLIALPAEVPAILTAGVLGLATLDRFGWQGRGGTLLVDWFANRSSAHRDRILHHEAGHFLVAHLLGIPVSGYALDAWEAFQQGYPGSGGVQFDDRELAAWLDRGEVPARILGHYTTVWMAGIAAEQLVYGNAQGGSDDRQKLLGLLGQLSRQNDPNMAARPNPTTQMNLSILRAKTLLQQQQPAYEALVQKLRDRASIEDCKGAIDQARLDEPASLS